MSTQLIERFLAGADAPRKAIDGLTPAQLNAPSPAGAPGVWTLQQNVVHLMDSDLNGTDRMKRAASMDTPLIIAYDESAYIRSLSPESLDPLLCCEVFRLNRVLTAEVLRRLPAAAWERSCIHNQTGKRTLTDLVRGYCDHLDNHLKTMDLKRRLIVGR